MIGYLPAPDLLRVGLTRARVLVLYALYGAYLVLSHAVQLDL
jgi:hypothetical protein